MWGSTSLGCGLAVRLALDRLARRLAAMVPHGEPKMRVVFVHAHFLHGQKLLHMLHITHIMAFERIIVHSRLHSAFSAFFARGGQLHLVAWIH